VACGHETYSDRFVFLVWPMKWDGVGATAVAAMVEGKARLAMLRLRNNDIGMEGTEARSDEGGGTKAGGEVWMSGGVGVKTTEKGWCVMHSEHVCPPTDSGAFIFIYAIYYCPSSQAQLHCPQPWWAQRA
jgi:hypothetical protein